MTIAGVFDVGLSAMKARARARRRCSASDSKCYPSFSFYHPSHWYQMKAFTSVALI